MKKLAALAAFAAVATFGGIASAQPVIDGTKDAVYGDAVAVQTVQTQFGDRKWRRPGGSELDAAYVTVCDGRLFVMLTGNQQQNFDKLNIFFDTQEGVGENVMSGLPEYDFTGGPGWISQNYGGHTFDAGFTAQYHMIVRSGGGDNYEVDWIDRLLGASADVNGNFGQAVGFGTVSPGTLANNAVASALANDIEFAFDNSNVAGVAGGTEAADQTAALAVMTGFEFSIDFADLGLDPTVANTIRVAAIIGNGDHNFHSNQTLGGLAAPQANLGGDGAANFTGNLAGIDFNSFAGDQFMTIELPAKGDADGNGVVNNVDIASFVLALTNPGAYAKANPGVDPDVVLDMNCDGMFSNLDIAGFVATLTGGGGK